MDYFPLSNIRKLNEMGVADSFPPRNVDQGNMYMYFPLITCSSLLKRLVCCVCCLLVVFCLFHI